MEYYVNNPTNFHKPNYEYELCPDCNQSTIYHWNEFEKRSEQLCTNIFCRVSRIWFLNTKK